MRRLLVTLFLLLAAIPAPAQDNAVKLTFLSWITGSTKLSFEHALPAHHQSSEITASLIGAGFDKYHNQPRGFTLRYGHKFFVSQFDEEHPLRGVYLRPEAVWSRYLYDSTRMPGTRPCSQMGALLATAGAQWTWNHFLADAWVGGGYAFGAPAETLYQHGFELWHWIGRPNEHIAMSFTIKLGYCF